MSFVLLPTSLVLPRAQAVPPALEQELFRAAERLDAMAWRSALSKNLQELR